MGWAYFEIVTGELSDRMQLPDCIWRETWNSARPIAVAQQARIFNETKEAEKVNEIGKGENPLTIKKFTLQLCKLTNSLIFTSKLVFALILLKDFSIQ